MRSSRHLLTALALVALSSASCKHATDGAVQLAQVVAAFDKAGWKASALGPMEPGKMSAQSCVGGTLAGLDAMLCEYGAAEAVLRGKKAAETWVGNAVTGVALSNGRTVLALADRTRSDPTGKSIHEISRAYGSIK